MPELPEVETVRRGLIPVLEGQRIARVRVRRHDLRRPVPPGFGQALTGRTVTALTRRAKYFILHLDDGQAVIWHLGMSGRMTIDGVLDPAGKHDHIVLETGEGRNVIYTDPRRFGLVDLCPEATLDDHVLLAHLGPDPFSEALTVATFSTGLRSRKQVIKAALLDQRLVAGLGNIYVCEALFRAKIGPERPANTLTGAEVKRLLPIIREVLGEAIAAGGSTLRDHARPDGELGYFQHTFRVYDHEGDPCANARPAERGHLIKRLVQQGRSTFYCPRCQT